MAAVARLFASRPRSLSYRQVNGLAAAGGDGRGRCRRYCAELGGRSQSCGSDVTGLIDYAKNVHRTRWTAELGGALTIAEVRNADRSIKRPCRSLGCVHYGALLLLGAREGRLQGIYQDRSAWSLRARLVAVAISDEAEDATGGQDGRQADSCVGAGI